jgi:hypothetical protein
MMKQIKDYEIFEHEWAHFHDVIFDVTYNSSKIDLTQEEMEKMFLELPEQMKQDAEKWGMNDTPWRDELCEWYKTNKMSN